MSDKPGRRYSDEELALIVERASALQDRAGEARAVAPPDATDIPATDAGLTLEAVHEIAEEVGLERRFVEEAAASLAYDPVPAGVGVLGGPTSHQLGGAFARQLTDSERVELLDVIRGISGHEGEVREVMGALEWTSVGRMTRTTVTIDSSADAVAVRVRRDVSGLAALTWIGSITTGLIAGGVVAGALQPASFVVAASIVGTGGMIGVALARSIWSRASRGLRDHAERLRDGISRYLLR